ncbi:MAG: hypothetical protein V2I43_26140 [Parvularcula sp.]|jgi:hypothetical protein|nr:hypothetical protein [Parvularcula sp.]
MTAFSTSPERGEERGFVLPVVLFVLAGLALILTATLRSFDLVAEELFVEQRRLEQELEIKTVSARMGYLLGTQPRRQGHLAVGEPLIDKTAMFMAGQGMDVSFLGGASFLSEGGPEALFLDGRPYVLAVGGSRYAVRVQDASGLLNPNIMTEEEVARLLARQGLSPGEANALAATLLDYIDFDDEPRFGGLERFGYPEGERPLDGPLPTRSALFDVPGWDRLPGPVRARLNEVLLPAGRMPKRNVNTAVPENLFVNYGLEESAVASAIAERQKQPFNSLSDMATRIGAAVEGDPFVIHTAPSSLYRLQIESLGGGPVYEAEIDLDPVNAKPVTIRPLGDWEGRRAANEDRITREPEQVPPPPDAFAVRGWEPL